MLNDIEPGTEVFIDANIFLYDILEHWRYGEVWLHPKTKGSSVVGPRDFYQNLLLLWGVHEK